MDEFGQKLGSRIETGHMVLYGHPLYFKSK